METMAWRKTYRYQIERSNQEEKGELGWDEFRTRKFRAWQHSLAMTNLTAWFIAETRLDWMKRFAKDPSLLAKYKVEVCLNYQLVMCGNCSVQPCLYLNYLLIRLPNLSRLIWATELALANLA